MNKNSFQIGANTQKLFDELPAVENTEAILDVLAFRADVAEWDKKFHFPYPKSISSKDFHEEKIVGVPVSVYRTAHANALTPTVLYIHGGGFFCELTEVHRSLCANIADRFACHVVIPHYSLSPENKAPKAVNEVTDVLKALLSSPEQYRLTNNITAIGYSSGGNLIWNAILNLLNSNNAYLVKNISNLILMSPSADLSTETTKNSPYQVQQDVDKMLKLPVIKQLYDWYLPPDVEKTDPRFSPIYRSSLDMKNMPPTTIIVGEIDCVYADAIKSAEIIASANVPTQLVILEGQSHNHSAHVGLRDGVFTPDIISLIMQKKSFGHLKGEDGLGVCVKNFRDKI